MRRSPYLFIVQPLQRLTLASLVLYLTFPLGALELLPLRTAPASAQSTNNRKTEADRLLKQGEELRDRNQSQAALEAFQQALKIYRQIKNRQGEGRALKNIGSAYDDLGDSKQATTYYQQALEIAQAINDTDLEARLLSNLGLVYLGLGNTQRATEYCSKALAVARQSQNHETEAIALKSLAAIYIGSNHIEKSLDFLEQALVAIRQANGSPEDKLRQRRLELRLLDAGGDLYYAIGATKIINKDETGHELLNKALQDYQQALTIAQQIGDRSKQAKAFLGLGEIYDFKSNYPKAVEFFQQALQIYQTDKKSPSGITKALFKLGVAYKNLNQPEEALKYLIQALNNVKTEVVSSPVEKLEQANLQGFILFNMGYIYSNTGNYEQAIESYKESQKAYQSVIDLAENNNSANKVASDIQKKQAKMGLRDINTVMLFAQKMLGLDDNTESNTCERKNNIPPNSSDAQKELAQAQENLKTYQALGKPELEAFAFAEVGDAYVKLKDNNRALENYNKAKERSTNTGTLQFQPYIFFKLGLFYDNQKQYNKAIDYYNQAVGSAQKIGNKIEQANIFKQMGMTSFLANKLPEATASLYQAIDVYDSIRKPVKKDNNQICIFETQAQTYSLLQKTLIAQNKFKEALEVSERGRARAFINLLYARMSKKSNDKLNIEIPEILPPKLQDIQRIAKIQNATIVEYAVPNPPKKNDGNLTWDGKEIYIWVVKPTGEVVFKSKEINIPLQDLVKTSRQAMGVDDRSIFLPQASLNKIDPEVVERLCKDLYQLLIKPIAQYLPTNPNEKVIFIPQNELFLVPFPALKDEQNQYLIEKHTILTAPAIQVLELTHQQRQKVTGNGALVVGNPTMPSIIPKKGEKPQQLQPLKNAEKEALEIAQILNTKSLVGNQATKSTVKQQMLNARIIHLATHGLLNIVESGVPGAIALAPDNLPNGEKKDNNGLLTASEILNMKLKAELVVLSACQTGQGDIKGDGVIGLSRSLIAAGVPSVVVSLWSVPDESTKLLMTEFYRQMQQTPDKAQALRQAMLITMKKYSEPIHWAAFTLIGESL
ncbi:TPR repeat-containing protein [Calothrix brevissima NIES-22]|nr:TPR repeat-containing protein [Calothrix brevissima NIES-22]